MWWWLDSARQHVAATRGFMMWNLGLAGIAPVLAWWLFEHPHRSRRLAWWTALAVFGAFLPNAPYVLTDVIHLFGSIRAGASDAEALTVLVPLYGVFIGLGVFAYVRSLDALAHFVGEHAGRSRVVALEVVAHLTCAVGVLLGRFARLNSWDLVARPAAVADALATLARPVGVACTLGAAAGLWLATETVRAVVGRVRSVVGLALRAS